MRRVGIFGRVAGCLLIWLIQPIGTGTAQVPGSAVELEEIVVIARKREENLQDLPLSIAAINAEAMREQSVFNVEQLSDLVPNLTLATNERADNTLVFIRGIGGGNPDPTRAFGTGMYIDGHYIPNSVGSFLSTLNIERVEVLRGPQGTLYGKNTTGGAINIISTKPSDEFASELTLRLGDYGRGDVRGMLNIPLSDNVFARLTAAHEQSDGYYYNRTLGADDAYTELNAFTGALRLTPGTSWTIDTSVTFAKNDDGGVGGQCAPGDEPWSRDRATWYGDDPAQTETYANCNRDVALGAFVNSSEKRSFTSVETTGAFISANWASGGRFGALDDASVTMNASYRNVDFDFLHDRDFTPFPIRAIGLVGSDPPRYTRTRSAEILFEGAVSDRLDFVTGFHFFEDETKNGNGRCYALFNLQFDPGNPDVDIPCDPVTAQLFEQTPLREQLTGGPSRTRIGEQSAWNTSYGLFGHLTYALDDRWTLEAGLRYTEDTREFNALEIFVSNVRIVDPSSTAVFDVAMNQQTVLEDGVISEGKATFSDTTPVLSLTRTLDAGNVLDDGMFYLRYAEGFLTGGFNTELPVRQEPLLNSVFIYGPEHVHNYEVGFKGSFADRRWQLNTSLFYMDYTDKQDFVRLDNRDGTLGLGDLVNIVWNISQVDIYGLELEARGRPWTGGLVTADVGYLINEFGEYTTIDNDFSQLDLSNLAISDLSPDWTVNLRIQHTFNLDNGGALRPMIGAYWQSEYEWQQGLERAAPHTRCFQDSYTKWQARLSYEPPSRRFEVSLFGKNIGDELIYERCDQNVGLYLYRYQAPATWGIEFLSRWGA